jgi:hypothetical protein
MSRKKESDARCEEGEGERTRDSQNCVMLVVINYFNCHSPSCFLSILVLDSRRVKKSSGPDGVVVE